MIEVPGYDIAPDIRANLARIKVAIDEEVASDEHGNDEFKESPSDVPGLDLRITHGTSYSVRQHAGPYEGEDTVAGVAGTVLEFNGETFVVSEAKIVVAGEEGDGIVSRRVGQDQLGGFVARIANSVDELTGPILEAELDPDDGFEGYFTEEEPPY